MYENSFQSYRCQKFLNVFNVTGSQLMSLMFHFPYSFNSTAYFSLFCSLYLACFLLYLKVMFIPADKRDLVIMAVPSLQQNLMLIATLRTSMPRRHARRYKQVLYLGQQLVSNQIGRGVVYVITEINVDPQGTHIPVLNFTIFNYFFLNISKKIKDMLYQDRNRFALIW